MKEVRRSLGWGCCRCATVNKGEIRVSTPTSPPPSEYKVPADGPDIDKLAVAAQMDQDWKLTYNK
jgi:hypothetical protein